MINLRAHRVVLVMSERFVAEPNASEFRYSIRAGRARLCGRIQYHEFTTWKHTSEGAMSPTSTVAKNSLRTEPRFLLWVGETSLAATTNRVSC